MIGVTIIPSEVHTTEGNQYNAGTSGPTNKKKEIKKIISKNDDINNLSDTHKTTSLKSHAYTEIKEIFLNITNF